ncbi:MAG TPA: tetratricopeptide repeat protein [Vicinamibacterales bacterium]|nr:sel1 repeat family protein [Acidobacteriota bacterium]HOC19505.1 tetratricopeptide repeat protein [Vicinamibacterales bacterium]
MTLRAPVLLAIAVASLGAVSCGDVSRLKARCLAGEVASCTELGDHYALGQGVERDLGRAGEAYSRACDGGAFDVCNALGEMYRETGPIEGGAERAEELFVRACEGGSSAGCLNLGLAFAEREDFARALALYERSCSAGWAAGCHQLGHSYEIGEGVKADPQRAIAWYGQACDGELVDGCVSAAMLLLTGTLVPADLPGAQRFFARAVALLDEGCQAGNDRQCTERDRLKTRIAIAQAGKGP